MAQAAPAGSAGGQAGSIAEAASGEPFSGQAEKESSFQKERMVDINTVKHSQSTLSGEAGLATGAAEHRGFGAGGAVLYNFSSGLTQAGHSTSQNTISTNLRLNARRPRPISGAPAGFNRN